MEAPEGWEDFKYVIGGKIGMDFALLRKAVANSLSTLWASNGGNESMVEPGTSETIYRVTFTPVRRLVKYADKATVENLEKGDK